MTKLQRIFFILTLFSSHSNIINGQNQVGVDINSEAGGDLFGFSVCMPDYLTLGVGAPKNSSNGQWSGHARVFIWSGTSWIQKGADIDGNASNDQFGGAISMPDANTIAVGAEYAVPGMFSLVGHVRIFSWNGSAWVQKGSDIEGNDGGIGLALSMPDANTIAIGSESFRVSSTNIDPGHVRVYTWNGSSWVQKGTDLIGDTIVTTGGWYLIGESVNMPNSNTLAIAGSDRLGNNPIGHVRIYNWTGTSWIQKGQGIEGEPEISTISGRPISMPDGNTIAIGAPSNAGNGFESGHVRIYQWNGSFWGQKGTDIDGEAPENGSGKSVSMPDPNTVAIGAPFNFNSNDKSGHVRIYIWNGASWIQKGIDIDGEHQPSLFGWSVSMPDANHVAIGGPFNNYNGQGSGHVRVYSFSSLSLDELTYQLTLYPNPAVNDLNISLLGNVIDNDYTIIDLMGKVVLKGNLIEGNNLIDVSMLPIGVYQVQLTNGIGKFFSIFR